MSICVYFISPSAACLESYITPPVVFKSLFAHFSLTTTLALFAQALIGVECQAPDIGPTLEQKKLAMIDHNQLIDLCVDHFAQK